MFHVHSEVRIKFSVSGFMLFYFSKGSFIYLIENQVKNKIFLYIIKALRHEGVWEW
jgi:cupin superfamily acireductone dioxygenase involved in methionine salvage